MKQRTGWMGAALAAASTAVLVAPAAAQEAPPTEAEVTAAREARAADDATKSTDVPTVQPSGAATSSGTAYLKDLYWLRSKQTTGGYIELLARDNPLQDNPGLATTTMRIYGNSGAFRDGAGNVGLADTFTCSGPTINSISIGASSSGGSISVSGGTTSKTLTWNSLNASSSELRHFYTEGGHFRCKVYNLAPAKTTRRGVASANYKSNETRAEDEYSFWW